MLKALLAFPAAISYGGSQARARLLPAGNTHLASVEMPAGEMQCQNRQKRPSFLLASRCCMRYGGYC